MPGLGDFISWQDIRPHVVRAGVDFARTAAADLFHAAPTPPPARRERLLGRGQPQVDDHGGCPYCQSGAELWTAIRDCKLARESAEPDVRDMFSDRVTVDLERAYRACDTLEVIANPAGARLLADIIRASADRSDDFDGRAHEIFRLHEEASRLAGIRAREQAK